MYYDPDKPNVSTSTFTWSYCDIPGWDDIRAELSLLVDHVDRPRSPFWRTNRLEIYKPYLPKLWAWFDSVGLEPLFIAWVHSLPISSGQIHTDLGGQDLALQLPVKDCVNTDTVIYRSTGPHRFKATEPMSYYWTPEHAEEIARYSLRDRPIVFNIKHPHNVVNHTKLHRQAISVRFKVDPWWLTRYG